jgi:glutathione S-transferase
VITVHHLNNSRSQRILWLLEELGVDYTIVHHQRDPKTMLAPASLKAVHPLGKSPVIVDGRNTLAESGAIIEYLADTYGKELGLAPEPGTSERLRYSYWLHYAEGSAMPPLLMSLIFSKIKTAPMPFFIRPIAKAIADKAMSGYVGPQVKLHLDYMNAELGSRPWFAGRKFSAADIQMSFPIEAASGRADMDQYPHLAAFLKKIHARGAYQRALEKGGPYELMR